MRTWLYDTLTSDPSLQSYLGGSLVTARTRVVPRESRTTISLPKPFLIYGLGNETNEDLSEDPQHSASRQFFQVWVHDEGASYIKIDEMVEAVKETLKVVSSYSSEVISTRWLETSQEFANQTYNTIYRYARFQAILGKGVPL